MRVAIAADHAGFTLKQELAPWLRASGYDGTDRGVPICGSGVGASVAANWCAPSWARCSAENRGTSAG